jgi:hypothetical protein
MARVTLFRNVLDTRDSAFFKDCAGKSVRACLEENKVDCASYGCEAEIYDPETGETMFCPIEDDIENPVNISVIVNGKTRDLDYVIQGTDDVLLQIIPADSVGKVFLGIAGGLLIAAGIVAAFWTGGASLSWAVKGGILLGTALAVGLGTFMVFEALKSDKKEEAKKGVAETNDSKNPTISGAQNQPLDGPFPLLIGKITCTPYVVGSLYNEFIMDPANEDTYFGTRQQANLLLAIAYAPVFVQDIKFNNLVAVHNKNNVLSGMLSYQTIEEDGTKYAADPEHPGQPITFNGKKSGYEVESMWNANNVQMELSQFGSHRTIYPYTVKQLSVDSHLLYCYDKQYSETARDELIRWQGGTFPSGLRTNTIKFSESVPWKVVVGLDCPNGLFRVHNDDEGNEIYDRIPMNFAVQWRPVYKYISENSIDSAGNSTDVYDPASDADGDVYSEKRFYGWRNFNRAKSPVVNKITYRSTDFKWYYTYSLGEGENIQIAKVGDTYGYYKNHDGHRLSGEFVAVRKGPDINRQKASAEAMYVDRYLRKTLSPEEVSRLKAYTDKHGNQYVYNNYIGHNWNTEIERLVTAKSYGSVSYDVWEGGGRDSPGQKNTYHYTYEEYAHYILNNTLPSDAATVIRNLASQYASQLDYDALWARDNPNKIVDDPTPSTAEFEVRMNKGLTNGTDFNSNPNWDPVEAFSLGAASVGKEAWKRNKSDPSITHSVITFSAQDYISAAKHQMTFEIEAELSKEDILELIDRNPKTKATDDSNDLVRGLTKCVMDSIEVRVVRLTPCYIDKTEGRISWRYSDIVKWAYLKTYCLDKNHLLEDIDNVKNTAEIYDETLKRNREVAYSDIDCSVETYKNTAVHPDGPTWLNWNIEDYMLSPVSSEDSQKLALLGVKCEPDASGQLSGNIDKINMTGYAVTPALLSDWTRYWYKEPVDGGYKYWYTDYYDSSDSRDLSLHPTIDGGIVWHETTYDDFDENAVTPIDDNYYYTEMNNAWDAKFFPEKIEPNHLLQLSTDEKGTPRRNANGSLMTEAIKHGNNWIPYIRSLMHEHRDSAGRWIATKQFREAFTDKNAIAQVLGFMVGQSLGKDAYWYNSVNDRKFVRFWYKEPLNGGGFAYWFSDTDDVAYIPGREMPFNEDTKHVLWAEGNESFYNSCDKTVISTTLSYSMRTPGSSFNMLALKEAYRYTDAVDIGGPDGPIPYKCNLYGIQQQKVLNLLNTILAAARAFWYYDELGRIEIHNEAPRKNRVLMLTDENVISSNFTRSFEKSIAGYHITFKDENNGYLDGEIYVLRQGQTREAHTKDIIDINLTGVTNPQQAWALGAYMLGMTITHRENWELKLNHVGNRLAIGSLVGLQSSILQIGTDQSGRIQKLIQDDNYIHGFICDRCYEYRAEYNEKDGRNVQGCSLFQADAKSHSKIVTTRFAGRDVQSTGIIVNGTTFANLKGQTNLVLFEKPIKKADERQVDQEAEEDTGTCLYTQFKPEEGDIVAFGNISSIFQDAVVYQLQPDEKGRVTASLYPYFDSLYRAGDVLPIYKTSMTRKTWNDTIPVSMEVSRTELNTSVSEAASAMAKSISEVTNGTAAVGAPDTISGITATARQDGIYVKWVSAGVGLKNAIDHYILQLTKTGDWDDAEENLLTSNSFNYIFDRTVDGYPEWDVINRWKFRVKARNIYGYEGEKWSTEAFVTTENYGTWKVPVPEVSVKVIDRAVLLTITPGVPGRTPLYGNMRYKVRVRRGAFDYNHIRYWMTDGTGYWYFNTNERAFDSSVMKDAGWTVSTAEEYNAAAKTEFSSSSDKDETHTYSYSTQTVRVAEDSEWCTPSVTRDPFYSHDNYKAVTQETEQKNRGMETDGVYSQTMPLYYTDGENEVYNFMNTPYYFDVKGVTEAGEGEWYSGLDDYPANPTERQKGVNATALCTNIRDIVKANETAKAAYIEELSAISANLGEITGGKMNGGLNNFWTLATALNPHPGPGNRDYQGAFRVGDDKEYIEILPVVAEDGRTITGYKGTLKFGTITLTGASAGDEPGLGTYITDENDDSRRMHLTAYGIEIETKDSCGNWEVTGRVIIDRYGNMIVTNDSETSAGYPTLHTMSPDDGAVIYPLDNGTLDHLGEDSAGRNGVAFSGTIQQETGLPLLNDTGCLEGAAAVDVSVRGGGTQILAWTRGTEIFLGGKAVSTADGTMREDRTGLLNGDVNTNYGVWGFDSAPGLIFVRG